MILFCYNFLLIFFYGNINNIDNDCHLFFSKANCLISSWRWVESDKILHVLPLHHTHGIGETNIYLTANQDVHALKQYFANTPF